MKVNDFIKWAKSVQKEENEIMLGKGKEYTVSDEDKFKKEVGMTVADFMKFAEEVGCTYTTKNLPTTAEEAKKLQEELQKITDSFIADTEQIGKDKEAELVQV